MAESGYSYEEMRAAALDILAGREKSSYAPDQYEHLAVGVAEVLNARSGVQNDLRGRTRRHTEALPAEAREEFMEVFWDLFRQGIITLGCNDSNRDFPFFRVSRAGRRILENQDTYFFHDVSSFTQRLRAQVPEVDEVTLMYAGESMQAFRAGCILSATVMLGVATEHVFLSLVETLEARQAKWPQFKGLAAERTILPKINKFKNVLDQNAKALPSPVKEDLDTHFAGILSIIRTFRNESGHPTGKVIDREQAYVLLNLFIPYCKKMHQLIAFFRDQTAAAGSAA